MTLYVEWLPPATAAAAKENDTPTFEAAALAFVEQWEAGGRGGASLPSSSSSPSLPLPPHERALETLPWVSIFNNWRHFVVDKTAYGERRALVSPRVAARLVSTMIEIATAGSGSGSSEGGGGQGGGENEGAGGGKGGGGSDGDHFSIAARSRWAGLAVSYLRALRTPLARAAAGDFGDDDDESGGEGGGGEGKDKNEEEDKPFSVDWRRIKRAIIKSSLLAPPALEGAMVREGLRESLAQLARASRRYFGTGSAEEVWAEHWPALGALLPSSPSSSSSSAPSSSSSAPAPADDGSAFEALGWLSLLLNHRDLASSIGGGGGDGKKEKEKSEWGPRVAAALDAADAVPGCPFWDNTWLHLFDRLAKHAPSKTAAGSGGVDWPALASRLMQRCLHSFGVPVAGVSGAASSSSFASRPPPARAWALFSGEGAMAGPSCATKLAVMLLGVPPAKAAAGEDATPASTAPEAEGGTAMFLRMLSALESFAHPSNSGHWSSALGELCSGAPWHLKRRLVDEEKAARWRSRVSSELKEEEQEKRGGGGGGGEGVGKGSGRRLLRRENYRYLPLRARLDRDVDAALAARALARLCGRAMFSKDRGLAGAARKGLARLSEAFPAIALPLVARRFVAALGAVAAPHQLAAAVEALALVVRPMLVRGLPVDDDGALALDQEDDDDESDDDDEGSDRKASSSSSPSLRAPRLPALSPDAGAAFVKDAVATLLSEGAIDANDSQKTLAALRVFAVALSSAPEAEPALPTSTKGGEREKESFSSDSSREDLNLAILPPSFLDDLLERLLGLLVALDSTAGGAGGGEKSGAGGGGGASGGGAGGNTGYGSSSSDGGGASFLLSSGSLLRPVVELAFARSTRAARARAVRSLARFTKERAMPCVAQETALLVNAAAWAEPKLAAEVLLPSLLDSVERHLPASKDSKGSPAAPLSKSAEASLCWQLSLVASCCYRCGFAASSDPRTAARLRAALLAAGSAPSRPAVEAASRAIASTLAGLLSCYPLGSQMMPLAAFSKMEEEEEGAGAMTNAKKKSGGDDSGSGGESGKKNRSFVPDAFIDPFASLSSPASRCRRRCPPPLWHAPPTDAEVALAAALVEDHVAGAAADLEAALALAVASNSSSSSSSSSSWRDAARAALLRAEGALGGGRSCLEEFAAPADRGEEGKGSRSSSSSLLVPLPAAALERRLVPGSAEARERLAAVVSSALRASAPKRAIDSSSSSPTPPLPLDAETATLLARVAAGLVGRGSSEHSEAGAAMHAWNADRGLLQEGASARLHESDGDGDEGDEGEDGDDDDDGVDGVDDYGDDDDDGFDGALRGRVPRHVVVERASADALRRLSLLSWREAWGPPTIVPPRRGRRGGEDGEKQKDGNDDDNRRHHLSARLCDLPPSFPRLVSSLLPHALGPYSGVRGTSVAALDAALKRAPCLSPGVLACAAAALARLPPPARPKGGAGGGGAAEMEVDGVVGGGEDPRAEIIDALLGIGIGKEGRGGRAATSPAEELQLLPELSDGDARARVPLGLLREVLSALSSPSSASEAAAAAAEGAGAGAGAGTPAIGDSSNEEDSEVAGAAGLLRSQALWRHATRHPAALALATAALAAGAGGRARSARAAASAADALGLHCLRFARPPLLGAAVAGAAAGAAVSAAGPSSPVPPPPKLPASIAALEDALLSVLSAPEKEQQQLEKAGGEANSSSSSSNGSRGNRRRAELVAAAAALTLLPPSRPEVARAAACDAAAALASRFSARRTLAAATLGLLLSPPPAGRGEVSLSRRDDESGDGAWLSLEVSEAAAEGAAAAISSFGGGAGGDLADASSSPDSSSYGSALLSALAEAKPHASGDDDGGGNGGHGGGGGGRRGALLSALLGSRGRGGGAGGAASAAEERTAELLAWSVERRFSPPALASRAGEMTPAGAAEAWFSGGAAAAVARLAGFGAPGRRSPEPSSPPPPHLRCRAALLTSLLGPLLAATGTPQAQIADRPRAAAAADAFAGVLAAVGGGDDGEEAGNASSSASAAAAAPFLAGFSAALSSAPLELSGTAWSSALRFALAARASRGDGAGVSALLAAAVGGGEGCSPALAAGYSPSSSAAPSADSSSTSAARVRYFLYVAAAASELSTWPGLFEKNEAVLRPALARAAAAAARPGEPATRAAAAAAVVEIAGPALRAAAATTARGGESGNPTPASPQMRLLSAEAAAALEAAVSSGEAASKALNARRGRGEQEEDEAAAKKKEKERQSEEEGGGGAGEGGEEEEEMAVDLDPSSSSPSPLSSSSAHFLSSAASLDACAQLVLAALASPRGATHARALGPFALRASAAALLPAVGLSEAGTESVARASGAACRGARGLALGAEQAGAAAAALAALAVKGGGKGGGGAPPPPSSFPSSSSSSSSSSAATRGAAIVSGAALWFLHLFLLPSSASSSDDKEGSAAPSFFPATALAAAAERALGDERREVAETAAAALSGYARALPPRAAAALRRRLVERAEATAPAKKKKKNPATKKPKKEEKDEKGEPTATPTPATRQEADDEDKARLRLRGERLAALLGLRALVGASPYDVPPWLPRALRAAVAAAAEPEPAGGAARAALSEFRRTHDVANDPEMLARSESYLSSSDGDGSRRRRRGRGLTAEEWEAIKESAGLGGGSYFV